MLLGRQALVRVPRAGPYLWARRRGVAVGDGWEVGGGRGLKSCTGGKRVAGYHPLWERDVKRDSGFQLIFLIEWTL